MNLNRFMLVRPSVLYSCTQFTTRNFLDILLQFPTFIVFYTQFVIQGYIKFGRMVWATLRKSFIMPIYSEKLSEFVYLPVLFSCVQRSNYNFCDILLKFRASTCFGLRMNALENGSNWRAFAITSHITPYFEN